MKTYRYQTIFRTTNCGTLLFLALALLIGNVSDVGSQDTSNQIAQADWSWGDVKTDKTVRLENDIQTMSRVLEHVLQNELEHHFEASNLFQRGVQGWYVEELGAIFLCEVNFNVTEPPERAKTEDAGQRADLWDQLKSSDEPQERAGMMGRMGMGGGYGMGGFGYGGSAVAPQTRPANAGRNVSDKNQEEAPSGKAVSTTEPSPPAQRSVSGSSGRRRGVTQYGRRSPSRLGDPYGGYESMYGPSHLYSMANDAERWESIQDLDRAVIETIHRYGVRIRGLESNEEIVVTVFGGPAQRIVLKDKEIRGAVNKLEEAINAFGKLPDYYKEHLKKREDPSYDLDALRERLDLIKYALDYQKTVEENPDIDLEPAGGFGSPKAEAWKMVESPLRAVKTLEFVRRKLGEELNYIMHDTQDWTVTELNEGRAAIQETLKEFDEEYSRGTGPMDFGMYGGTGMGMSIYGGMGGMGMGGFDMGGMDMFGMEMGMGMMGQQADSPLIATITKTQTVRTYRVEVSDLAPDAEFDEQKQRTRISAH